MEHRARCISHASHHNTTMTTIHHNSIGSRLAPTAFTNTAKLPIETVKKLIAAVSRRPHLWIRSGNSQKRCDINALWQQVGQEVHLPADICRIKWGHLRDNFRKVFIRNTLSREAPTTWRFYNDMRFMEAAVAENVMRQHRLREQSLYYQRVHNKEAQLKQEPITSTLFDLRESLNHCPQHFSFSELSVFFNDNRQLNKRIKLEPLEAGCSQDQNQTVVPTVPVNKYLCSGIDLNTRLANLNGNGDDDGDDDDGDDEFDEDAPAEESQIVHNSNSTNNNARLCAINIFRNNGEDNVYNETAQLKSPKAPWQKSLPDVSLNSTESVREAVEYDADRMFLLSLLPYLHKVDKQRKLRVRQKLQKVLIDEFG